MCRYSDIQICFLSVFDFHIVKGAFKYYISIFPRILEPKPPCINSVSNGGSPPQIGPKSSRRVEEYLNQGRFSYPLFLQCLLFS